MYEQNADPNDPELANKIKLTKVLRPGAAFGEIALLQNGVRTATVRANESCKTYVLDGNVFKTIVEPSLDKNFVSEGYLVDLQATQLFNTLEQSQKERLLDALK